MRGQRRRRRTRSGEQAPAASTPRGCDSVRPPHEPQQRGRTWAWPRSMARADSCRPRARPSWARAFFITTCGGGGSSVPGRGASHGISGGRQDRRSICAPHACLLLHPPARLSASPCSSPATACHRPGPRAAPTWMAVLRSMGSPGAAAAGASCTDLGLSPLRRGGRVGRAAGADQHGTATISCICSLPACGGGRRQEQVGAARRPSARAIGLSGCCRCLQGCCKPPRRLACRTHPSDIVVLDSKTVSLVFFLWKRACGGVGRGGTARERPQPTAEHRRAGRSVKAAHLSVSGNSLLL